MEQRQHHAFGILLRRHRLLRGWTQAELAERANMSVEAIGALERGTRRTPWPGTVARITAALSLSTEDHESLAGVVHGAGGRLIELVPPLPPTNLPDEPTPFIGREHEIDEVARLIRDPHIRMVTLTGPGGTGKTRLALRVAETLLDEYRDGVFFVNLAPFTDPAVVPAAIAEVLAVRAEPDQDILASVTSALGGKRVLLVLDNYEHVREAASVVASLLEGCRSLHVLVTSRTPLHLSREHEYAVPPLAVPDLQHPLDAEALVHCEAVALFVDRARAVKADFALTEDDAETVAEICARLDGLPLAIELAAARIKLFPPQALLPRLSSSLRVLTGGPSDRPTRQQTLRSTMEWSFSLLTTEEQTLFARLSAFAGSWTLDAAEAVCDADGELDVLDAMTSLLDQSLVRQSGTATTRLSMLQTVREYAQEKLQEREEEARIQEAHAQYFLALAEEAEPELTGPAQRDWLARLDAELDNMRLALRWLLAKGAQEDELRLASALFRYWQPRGLWSEGRWWLEAGLASEDAASRPVRAKALWSFGYLASLLGDGEQAEARLGKALEMYRALDDASGIASAVGALGLVAMREGRYERATALYKEGLRLSEDQGDQRGRTWLLFTLGTVAWYQCDLPHAKERYRSAIAVAQAASDVYYAAFSMSLLGQIAMHEGKPAEAERLSQEGLALAQDAGLELVVANALRYSARVAHMQGNLERANEQVRESMRLARQQGERYVMLYNLDHMARLALAEGSAQRAARLKGAEEALRERLHIPIPIVYQAEATETVDQAKAALDPVTFTDAWEAGRAMRLDEAVAYALDESE